MTVMSVFEKVYFLTEFMVYYLGLQKMYTLCSLYTLHFPLVGPCVLVRILRRIRNLFKG